MIIHNGLWYLLLGGRILAAIGLIWFIILNFALYYKISL